MEFEGITPGDVGGEENSPSKSSIMNKSTRQRVTRLLESIKQTWMTVRPQDWQEIQSHSFCQFRVGKVTGSGSVSYV